MKDFFNRRYRNCHKAYLRLIFKNIWGLKHIITQKFNIQIWVLLLDIAGFNVVCLGLHQSRIHFRATLIKCALTFAKINMHEMFCGCKLYEVCSFPKKNWQYHRTVRLGKWLSYASIWGGRYFWGLFFLRCLSWQICLNTVKGPQPPSINVLM